MSEYSINFDAFEAVILVDSSSSGNTNIVDLIRWCEDNVDDYEIESDDGYSSAAFCFHDYSDAESFNYYRSKSCINNYANNPFNHLQDIVFSDY
jgi:hypothetical protein